jgi:hypothetical protein
VSKERVSDPLTPLPPHGRRGPCAFRQRDVTRALKAARKAGYEHVRVEVDTDGRIIVIVGKVGVEFAPPRNGETPEDVKKLI